MTNPTRKDDPIEFRMGALLSDLRPRLVDPDRQDKHIAEIRTQVEAGLKQAREDAFNTIRTVFKHPGQDDRWTFLQFCLNGWIESGAQGFLIVEYDPGVSRFDRKHVPGLKGQDLRPARVLAINQGDEYHDDEAVRMILATGNVCTKCGVPLTHDGASHKGNYTCPRNGNEHEPEQAVFEVTHETIELGLQRIRHALNIPNAGTGSWERNLTSIPNLGQGLRDLIIQADLTNDATLLDIWGYSMIVEVACFNQGVYA